MFGYGIFFALYDPSARSRVVRYLAEQKRQKEVQQLAEQLGLEHSQNLSEVDYLRFQRFPIASEGRSVLRSDPSWPRPMACEWSSLTIDTYEARANSVEPTISVF